MSVEMKDVVVRYIMHPNTGRGIGCVVAVNTPEGIKTGWSQCNPTDNFNRKAARAIAIQRAISPPRDEIRPASVKFRMYRPSDSPFQPPKVSTVVVANPIEGLLEMVAGVAKRAFDPNKPAREVAVKDVPFERGMGAMAPPGHPVQDGFTVPDTELPPGLAFVDEHKKLIADVKSGKVVAKLVNDEYVPVGADDPENQGQAYLFI